MKIGEILSLYRTTIRARQQTCSLNDRELYLRMNSIANIIKQQILDKGHKLGYKNYHTINIDLEPAKFKSHCHPEWMGCDVLKSTIEIPNTLVNSMRYELLIYSGRTSYSPLSFMQGKRLQKHPMLKNYYDIIDNYLDDNQESIDEELIDNSNPPESEYPEDFDFDFERDEQ